MGVNLKYRIKGLFVVKFIVGHIGSVSLYVLKRMRKPVGSNPSLQSLGKTKTLPIGLRKFVIWTRK